MLIMRIDKQLKAGLLLLASACTPPPAVEQSRDVLWAQYGHKPVDAVLVALGTPERESHLTDGSRMLTYRFGSSYDSGTPYERETQCEATFIAKAPHFSIDNVAMLGDAYECSLLAQGHTGFVQHPTFDTPPPYVATVPPYIYRYRY